MFFTESKNLGQKINQVTYNEGFDFCAVSDYINCRIYHDFTKKSFTYYETSTSQLGQLQPPQQPRFYVSAIMCQNIQ